MAGDNSGNDAELTTILVNHHNFCHFNDDATATAADDDDGNDDDDDKCMMMIMMLMTMITGSPKSGPLCSSGRRARSFAQSDASKMKSHTALISLVVIIIVMLDH